MRRSRIGRLGSVLLLVVVCLAPSACTPPVAAPVSPSGTTTTETPGPEVVVRQYYEAIAAGDMKAAAALQTANARQAHVGLQGPPSISIKRLEIGPFDAVIADGTRPDHLKAYAEIRETYVTYDLLKDLPAERAGRIGRFVIVARETSTSPWRIDSEGTGP